MKRMIIFGIVIAIIIFTYIYWAINSEKEKAAVTIKEEATVTTKEKEAVTVKKEATVITMEEAAVAVADKWLNLVDSGKYSESWREANEYFKNSVKQDQWALMVQPVRKNLGKLISRKLKAKIYKNASTGEPQGQYIIVQYETSFQNKKLVIEEVVAMLEKNDRWKVSGYHLR